MYVCRRIYVCMCIYIYIYIYIYVDMPYLIISDLLRPGDQLAHHDHDVPGDEGVHLLLLLLLL